MADYESIYSGAEIDRRLTDVDSRIALPSPAYAGLYPRGNAQGQVDWVPQGQPTDAQTAAAVTAWLAAHPEATTTVQDGSLTHQKFSAALKTEVGGRTNPNLLDNWDFGNPVNQRGSAEYDKTGTTGYGLDRWLTRFGITTLLTDGVRLQNPSAAEAGVMRQIPEPSLVSKLSGKVVTISVMLTDGTVYAKSGIYGSAVISAHMDSSGNRIQIETTGIVNILIKGGASKDVKSVKLELGAVSTLANDAPPNYAEELAKCQRYFYAFRSSANRNFLFTGAGTTTGGAGQRVWMGIPLPVQMRTNPTVSLVQQGGISIRMGGVTTIFTSSNSALNTGTSTPMQASILLAPNTVPAHWEMYNPVQAYTTGATETVIFISADL